MSLRNEVEKKRRVNAIISSKLSIRLAKTIYLSENLLHTRFIRWIVHIDYRMRSNIDALIVVTLILLIWWNCLSHDIIDLEFSKVLNCLLVNCRRNYSRKIVWIDHLSEDSLRWCSIECNVHINSRICRNINALIVIAMILLTWRKCSFHRIIDLMLQEFNVYINVFITFKARVFDSLHSKLRIRLWKSKFSIVCLFHHLRHSKVRIDCRSISLSTAMISISDISHRFAFVIKVQVFLFTSKAW